MDTKQIIAELDTEIARLQEVKSILSGTTPNLTKTRRSPNKVKTKATPIATQKRVLSPEAREKIAVAQKARWAKFNKAKKAAKVAA